MTAKEIWKKIKDFPSYKVSNLGKVKSLDRILHCKDNKIKKLKGRILKNCFNGNYYHVRLSKNNIKTMYMVHRLVILHFGSPKPTEKHQCNHKDGIKLHNWIDNLEWVTQQENTQHAYKLGLIIPSHEPKPKLQGSNHHNSKLNEKIVMEIRNLYKNKKYTYEKIAEIYDVHLSSIGLIVNRKIWKHV